MHTVTILNTEVTVFDKLECMINGITDEDYPIALVAQMYSGSKEIIVNETYMRLPQRLQEAGIAHEIGHISLGHCKHEHKGLPRSLKNELSADDYAVKQGYKLSLIELLTRLNSLVYHKENITRINALK
jgi:Zn-dependent protease with chaperone function